MQSHGKERTLLTVLVASISLEEGIGSLFYAV